MGAVKTNERVLQSRAERYSAGNCSAYSPRATSTPNYIVTDDRDPVAILSETDKTRIPELLPIRYQRIAVSPFTFLRGAAAVMATDLVRTPRVGISVQACGDCHLMNFGAFDTPEGRLRHQRFRRDAARRRLHCRY